MKAARSKPTNNASTHTIQTTKPHTRTRTLPTHTLSNNAPRLPHKQRLHRGLAAPQLRRPEAAAPAGPNRLARGHDCSVPFRPPPVSCYIGASVGQCQKGKWKCLAHEMCMRTAHPAMRCPGVICDACLFASIDGEIYPFQFSAFEAIDSHQHLPRSIETGAKRQGGVHSSIHARLLLDPIGAGVIARFHRTTNAPKRAAEAAAMPALDFASLLQQERAKARRARQQQTQGSGAASGGDANEGKDCCMW